LGQILFRLERRVKQQVRTLRRRTQDKALAMRCQIVLLADKQRSRASIAESVGCSVSWVQRVLRRFRELGVAGLYDARADNGTVKLDEHYLLLLYETVDQSPRDYHYIRPTWTQELLAKVMAYRTGVKVHRSTMSRALHRIRARLGKPRPTAGCPWPKSRKTRRLNELQRLVDHLPKHELAFYVDEVDIHLNPKIGLDWMNYGKQKQVPTPGKNKKRYLAGAMNAATRQITWVRAERKNSLQVIALIRKLVDEHPQAKVIHLILDNCKTHHSKITQAAVTALAGKVKLHFLPPYCPDGNDIERIWLDLHANVTRNHRCGTMSELMSNVYEYLRNRNRTLKRQAGKAA
jgi:transposase